MAELLAPAGSREAFAAALASGADAVYLGGRQFGARAYASNFSDEELVATVKEAHLFGVSVYVTVNTLVDDSEIPAVAAYLRLLYEIGVDAVIVQDLGVAAIARRVAPELPLHASTQMTVHNLAGVEFIAAQGFTRVVLARELSLADIRIICRKAPIEIETFIHGALCISYSGQCLMSSMIGGRSGNRGRCAQPCRLPYTLVDRKGGDALAGRDAGEYLLSPKDFNTIEHIPDLIEAGVASFKIEGRMKRAEYVAVVVDNYRRAIDAYQVNAAAFAVAGQDRKDMEQIFNRGFTNAYLYGKQGRAMMSDRRPNNRGVRVGRVLEYNPRDKTAAVKLDESLAVGDVVEFWVKIGGRTGATVTALTVDGRTVEQAPPQAVAVFPVQAPVRPGDRVFKTFDAALMAKARTAFAGGVPARRVPIDAAVAVEEGSPLTVTLADDEGNKGNGQTAFLAEKALKRPLTEETVAGHIGRLGTTVFALRRLDCRIDGEVMVPLSEINEARRQAVDGLEKARLARYARPSLAKEREQLADLISGPAAKHAGKPKLAVNVDTVAKAVAAADSGADILVFGGENLDGMPLTADDYRQVVDLCRRKGLGVILSTPRLVQEGQWPALEADLELFGALAPDAVSVANLGVLQRARATGLALHGDWPLNIYNSVAARFFAEQGVAAMTLSPELTFTQLEAMCSRPAAAMEAVVHGYLTLMISEYCIMGSFLGGLGSGPCTRPCRKEAFWLKDRLGERFRVASDQFCRMHILNAKELSMLPHVPRLAGSGLARIRIEGKAADAAHIARITGLYRALLDQGGDHPLLAGDQIKTVEHSDITRGHFFRGVL